MSLLLFTSQEFTASYTEVEACTYNTTHAEFYAVVSGVATIDAYSEHHSSLAIVATCDYSLHNQFH